MKQREINISGLINNCGKLAIYMDELNAFTSMWKNVRVILTLRVHNPGSSMALRGYYFNYIVPRIKRALWEIGDRKTDEQTELWIREMSPIMYKQEADLETGKYTTILRNITELDNSELIEHIETIRQMAAEELSVFIDDPNTI